MKIDNQDFTIYYSWANFYKGEFISNTILNANSFEKLIK